jgi:hypothetical protein
MVKYTLHCLKLLLMYPAVHLGDVKIMSESEECLLGCHTMSSVKNLPPFCSNLPPPYSG